MNHADVCDVMALIAAYLQPPVRTRVLGLLPDELRESAMRRMETPFDDLSGVAGKLKIELVALFGDAGADESDLSPLRVADVLAFVAMRGTPQQAAEIVRRLPEAVEAEVVHLIAAQDMQVLKRRLDGDEWAFVQALSEVLGERIADPAFAAQMLRHIQNPGIVRRILTGMHDKDPDSAGQVQDLMFGFNELVRLPDRELQMVLRGVDHWDLILALRPAPVALRRKIISNLSERRATLVEEDGNVLEDVDDAQVAMVQQQIVDRARLLYESGDVHTYMGSIDRGEVTAEAEEQPLPDGGIHHIRTPAKARRQYGAGIAVGIFTIVLGALFLIWFDRSPQPMSSSGRVRVLPGDQAADVDSAMAQERGGFRARPRPGALGNAAVISGRALLMSGESVRSLDEGIQPGDRIKTDAEGRAEVSLWGDSGQVQIEGESEVQLGQADQPSGETPRLDMRVGNIWVRVKNPILEMTSPLAAVTASEGALYRLRIALNATTTLTVHEGTAWVKNRADGEVVVLGAGERLRIEPGGRMVRDRHEEAVDWQE